MKADLHMHSLYSDGKHTVSELLEFADNMKLDYIAVTDHDTYSSAFEDIDSSVKVIFGLELSTVYNGESVHILGYFKKKEDIEKLKVLLDSQKASRKDRAIKMARLLKEFHNINLDLSFTEKIESVSRGTIALEIIKQGYNYTMEQIFDKFIGKGCRAYIPSVKLETEEGIKAIKTCNGLAVLAHPMLLKAVDPMDIISLGVDGIEAVYNSFGNLESAYRKLAFDNGLFITGGSDFHFYNDNRHGNIGEVFIEGKDLENFLGRIDEL